MEITIRENGNNVVFENVKDCVQTEEGYKILFNSNNKSIITEGTILGVTTYDNLSYDNVRVRNESLAIKFECSKDTIIPILPLSESCSYGSDEWDYNPHYQDIGEIKPKNCGYIFRNVDCLSDVDAVPYSNEEVGKLRLKPNSGGYKISEEKLTYETEYVAAFGSAWTSYPLEGKIQRITSYIECDNYKSEVYPTKDTFEQVDWAFE